MIVEKLLSLFLINQIVLLDQICTQLALKLVFIYKKNVKIENSTQGEKKMKLIITRTRTKTIQSQNYSNKNKKKITFDKLDRFLKKFVFYKVCTNYFTLLFVVHTLL